MGRTSLIQHLPSFLHKSLPRSRTSAVRIFAKELDTRHNLAWQTSTRYHSFQVIDASNATTISRHYWKLSRELPRRLLVLLTQLRTGHIPLQKHLHRIKKADADTCPCCNSHPETVHHYLMICTSHKYPRERLRRNFPNVTWNIATLLNEPDSLEHLFSYVNDTGRFRHIMGDLPQWSAKTATKK